MRWVDWLRFLFQTKKYKLKKDILWINTNVWHISLFHSSKVELPDITSLNQQECIADLKLRKEMRINYPGACSLEFQNIMQIVIETLFNWDTKKQEAKGPGIFGTVVAFAPADEEQGRKTLHRQTISHSLWSAAVQTLGEADRSLHDALCVIRSLVKKRCSMPAGSLLLHCVAKLRVESLPCAQVHDSRRCRRWGRSFSEVGAVCEDDLWHWKRVYQRVCRGSLQQMLSGRLVAFQANQTLFLFRL